jgi:hypothetical protein
MQNWTKKEKAKDMDLGIYLWSPDKYSDKSELGLLIHGIRSAAGCARFCFDFSGTYGNPENFKKVCLCRGFCPNCK